MRDATATRWLLLIHQIPPQPAYFRVKIWRRLQQVGAVALKQSVYVLPEAEQTREDFSWILREIKDGGGEASLCEAAFIDGVSEDQIVNSFRAARRVEYEAIIAEAQALLAARSAEVEGRSQADARLQRLQKKLADTQAIDFFSCPEGKAAQALLANLEERLKEAKTAPRPSISPGRNWRGLTWVTRRNVYVDRIACAWLIRRFVDGAAAFKFVGAAKYKPRPGEVRFDMFDAEFTHEGDRCTFEVMIDRFGLDRRRFALLAEIVHDLDLKDEKFGRPETAGMKTLFAAIVAAHPGDAERIEAGGRILDVLWEHAGSGRTARTEARTG